MQTTTEEILLARAREGDREAFADLVRAHQNMVFGMIMKQIGDREIAGELAQDTFVKAWRHLGGFRADSSFSTWLIKIALNQSRSYFSSKEFRESRTKISEPEILETIPNPGGEEVYSKLQILKLKQAVSLLKEKYRDVVLLISFEEKSYREAAEILSIPEGTVASRMNTAVNQLRKKLSQLSES